MTGGGVVQDEFRNLKFSLPNADIETIYCDKCEKLVSWWTTQGHYLCAECDALLGWWMGTVDGVPMAWNKQATETHVVKHKMKVTQ